MDDEFIKSCSTWIKTRLVKSNVGLSNANILLQKERIHPLIPNAWRGKDNADTPDEQWTDGSGAAEFWAPPKRLHCLCTCYLN